MSQNREYVDVLVDMVLHVTANAFLFEIDGGEVWIPQSQVEDADKIHVGQENVIVAMPLWLAKQHDLSYE